MPERSIMPIKKRPLKAEIHFLVHQQPPVETPPTNPVSRDEAHAANNPPQPHFTPITPVIQPQPSSSDAPQQIPRNDQSLNSSQIPLDRLTLAPLSMPGRHASEGNFILKEIHPNRTLRRNSATSKTLAKTTRNKAPIPPGSSAQHAVLENYALPARLPPSTPAPNPGNLHRQQPSRANAGNLPSRATSRRKRSYHSDTDTSEIQPNPPKRGPGATSNNNTPSLRPSPHLGTSSPRDEIQPNTARPQTRSQQAGQAVTLPSASTNSQPMLPMRMQEVTNNVHCDICDAPFFNAEAVERHKASQHPRVTGREAAAWECPICGVLLRNRQNLNRHERAHGKGATLPCPMCNVLFTTQRSRTLHMRYKHALPAVTRGPSTRSYTCSRCSYASIQKTNVLRHVTNVHLKLRTHHCPFEGCDYSASTKANLEAHKMSNMHKSAKEEDEEDSDQTSEDLNFTSEEGSNMERTWKDDDDWGGEGGAGSALPNASLPVF